MPIRAKMKGPSPRSSALMDALVIGILALQAALGAIIFAAETTPESQTSHQIVTADIDRTRPEKSSVRSKVDTYLSLPKGELVAPFAPRPPRLLPAVAARARISSASSFMSFLGEDWNRQRWYVANYSNRDHPFFENDWSNDNARFSDQGLKLAVGKKNGRWSSGEVKTRAGYGYGRYEVVMKPAKSSGLVSAFFTYTGPYFGDPHDEIDIEFLGNNTRKVEFNYFKDGRTLRHKVLDLPFDAADDFHIYAFEWYPDRIRWFVDNELQFETLDGDTNIPRTAGSIYMNMWTGNLRGLISWHGRPKFSVGTKSEYACVSYTAAGTDTRRCSDVFELPNQVDVPLVSLAAANPPIAVANNTPP